MQISPAYLAFHAPLALAFPPFALPVLPYQIDAHRDAHDDAHSAHCSEENREPKARVSSYTQKETHLFALLVGDSGLRLNRWRCCLFLVIRLYSFVILVFKFYFIFTCMRATSLFVWCELYISRREKSN